MYSVIFILQSCEWVVLVEFLKLLLRAVDCVVRCGLRQIQAIRHVFRAGQVELIDGRDAGIELFVAVGVGFAEQLVRVM